MQAAALPPPVVAIVFEVVWSRSLKLLDMHKVLNCYAPIGFSWNQLVVVAWSTAVASPSGTDTGGTGRQLPYIELHERFHALASTHFEAMVAPEQSHHALSDAANTDRDGCSKCVQPSRSCAPLLSSHASCTAPPLLQVHAVPAGTVAVTRHP